MKKSDISNLDWLQQIRTEDPAIALEIATAQLRQCSLKGSDRLHWLFAVDNVLQPIALALVQQFADARRLSAEDEINLWEAGRIYHDLQAGMLVALLREVAEKSIPVAEAPAIVARTLYHRGRSALWRYLRYIPLPEGWWLDTHKIFAFAEREQISTSEIMMAVEQSPTHSAALYLQMLLLDTLNRTNMSRQQIVALAQWLTSQTEAISVERVFAVESQLFFVNLEEDKAGRRIRNFEPSPSCRYWRTDDLLAEIEIELEKAETGQIPEIDTDLLYQMHAEWSRTGYKRQRRTVGRNEVEKRASVAHGIYAVCQEVHSQTMGSTQSSLEGETWVIDNESINGFGALVSTELNTWLKIGRLITLREEMNFGMSVVAVVRSLQQREEGKVYVGAEVLGYMALYALLQDWPANGSHPYPGIFLASDEERALPSSLLLPAIEYQSNAELRLKMDRRTRHVKLGALIEQKDDWCRVAVETMED
jgi:hypothetical protein